MTKTTRIAVVWTGNRPINLPEIGQFKPGDSVELTADHAASARQPSPDALARYIVGRWPGFEAKGVEIADDEKAVAPVVPSVPPSAPGPTPPKKEKA